MENTLQLTCSVKFWICLAAVVAFAAAAAPSPPLQRFEFNRPSMGLPFRIVLYAASSQLATNAAEAAFKRIQTLDSILSDYDAGSELSLLSRSSGSNRWVAVSSDLWHVLDRAQAMARRTHGAFDVTVGPAVVLWRKARREQRMPDLARLRTVLDAIGYRRVHLDSRQHAVRLDAPNMRLDLGAIAKGYAIDQALDILTRHGIRSALVAGGGDLAVSAAPPDQRGWRIEIGGHDHPQAPPPRLVEISHRGLASSGDSFQKLEIDGIHYSHIVDPRTGIGFTNRSLATVIAKDCMTADAWSTSLSVLGADPSNYRVRPPKSIAFYALQELDGMLRERQSASMDGYSAVAQSPGLR